MRTELLAPAKNLETAIAAIDCGADAVYIGGPFYGARYKASNSIDDIKKLVEYAHKYYVKVYVTLNTILDNKELEEARNLINELYYIKVDGLIIQDMGIIKLAIEKEIPPIPLHISTQCDNRDLEKIKFYEKIGLPRVVLARELSIEKIEAIKKYTKIELECFIHGALCVSYSGQCYLSEFIGRRSANRGECAQPCRKKYTLVDDNDNIILKNKYLLSTKDFNASNYLEEMVDIGVKSFKIEGRLKDIEYVKNVVLYYRKELDKYSEKTSSGIVITNFSPNITKSFNRGYTDYFLNGRTDCFCFDSPKDRGCFIGKIREINANYFIVETKEKLNPQDGLVINNFGCLVNKVDKNKIYPNKMPNIKVGDVVYRNKDFCYEKALNVAKIERKIAINIEINDKGVLKVFDEDMNMVSVNIPNGEIAKNQEKMNSLFTEQLQKTGNTIFIVKNIKNNFKIPFLPISEINKLRRTILDNLLNVRLKNYKQELQQDLVYSNYYKSIEDYRANVYNDKAKEFYGNCNCLIKELAYERTHKSNVELMRTKHCIKYALGMCKSPKTLFLIDEKGERYNLIFDCKNCEMIIQR